MDIFNDLAGQARQIAASLAPLTRILQDVQERLLRFSEQRTMRHKYGWRCPDAGSSHVADSDGVNSIVASNSAEHSHTSLPPIFEVELDGLGVARRLYPKPILSFSDVTEINAAIELLILQINVASEKAYTCLTYVSSFIQMSGVLEENDGDDGFTVVGDGIEVFREIHEGVADLNNDIKQLVNLFVSPLVGRREASERRKALVSKSRFGYKLNADNIIEVPFVQEDVVAYVNDRGEGVGGVLTVIEKFLLLKEINTACRPGNPLEGLLVLSRELANCVRVIQEMASSIVQIPMPAVEDRPVCRRASLTRSMRSSFSGLPLGRPLSMSRNLRRSVSGLPFTDSGRQRTAEESASQSLDGESSGATGARARSNTVVPRSGGAAPGVNPQNGAPVAESKGEVQSADLEGKPLAGGRRWPMLGR